MSAINQTLKDIQAEARRCLYCVDAPCQKGCPASVDVAQFIRHLRYADVKSAKRVIKQANPLGGICGTLCPSEELCQKNCTMGRCGAPIHIRDLQKYACANASYSPALPQPNGKRVAVVGAGPAGLGCAAALAALGYQVEVFEKDGCAAGVVAREIPGYRISAAVVENDLAELPGDRVHIHYDSPVTAEDIAGKLSKEYDAVFVGAGLSADRMSGVDIAPGAPVAGCSRFLAELKSGAVKSVSGTVVVIGGGDSAIDAVCSSLACGADKAVLAYRRSREEMPACDEEFLSAADKGVELMYMVSPVSITAEGDGAAVTFVRNRLVERPGESRKGFEPAPGSEFTIRASQVVFAIGKTADTALLAGKADPDTLRVGDTNCFAGGDYLSGGATVVRAVADGKKAAAGIHAYLS